MLRDADTTPPTFREAFKRHLGRSTTDFANHPSQGVTGHARVSDDAAGSSSVSLNTDRPQAVRSGPSGAAEGAGIGPLGIYPKSVDSLHPETASKAHETRRLASRRQLYADLKTSALILREAIPNKVHAVAKCRWVKVAGAVTLNLMDVGGGQQRAAFKGVKICGNVWGCPVCAARISQTRRAEMNRVLAWARERGLVPVMLTLTARHGLEDRLGDMLDWMKNAKRRLRQRAEWRRLPVAGTITATEITHGTRNGWHPHFHEIVLLEASGEAEALAMVAPLGDAWRASLRAFGLDGAAAAFDAQGAASAGDYVAKWGVAEEITLTGSKRGRAKGRSPRELVRLAGAGDEDARSLWLEFFAATSGKRRRQLVWSPGLKAACGVDEITDEQAAEAEDARQEEELAEYDNEAWRRVRSKRVRLLEAAERGGSSAVRLAESGPDDADPEPASEVIDRDGDEPRQADGQAAGDDFDKVGHPGNLSAWDAPTANTAPRLSHMHAPDLKTVAPPASPATRRAAGRGWISAAPSKKESGAVVFSRPRNIQDGNKNLRTRHGSGEATDGGEDAAEINRTVCGCGRACLGRGPGGV